MFIVLMTTRHEKTTPLVKPTCFFGLQGQLFKTTRINKDYVQDVFGGPFIYKTHLLGSEKWHPSCVKLALDEWANRSSVLQVLSPYLDMAGWWGASSMKLVLLMLCINIIRESIFPSFTKSCSIELDPYCTWPSVIISSPYRLLKSTGIA